MIAVARGIKRRLQPDRNRLLPNIKMAKPADQSEAIKLPRLFLEAPDQQHLMVETQHRILIGNEPFRLGGLVHRSFSGFALCGSGQGFFPSCEDTQVVEARLYAARGAKGNHHSGENATALRFFRVNHGATAISRAG